jgi:hypothetical protein
MPYFAVANFDVHKHVLPCGESSRGEELQVLPLRFAFLAEAEAPVGMTEFWGLDVLSRV